MAEQSTRSTGNEPVEGIDPGGTRPTKPGNPDKSGAKPKVEAPKVEQNVQTGDRNDLP